MKTDDDLSQLATLIITRLGYGERHTAVKDLRRFYNDAILDFVDDLDEYDAHTARALRSVAAKKGITRSTSIECEDGKCCVRMLRCEECNKAFQATYYRTTCICGGRLELV